MTYPRECVEKETGRLILDVHSKRIKWKQIILVLWLGGIVAWTKILDLGLIL